MKPKKTCCRCEPAQAIVWDWRKTKGFQRCCYGFLYVGFKIICLWPKKLSHIWHEDSCWCNMRQEYFGWGSGQDFSTFWESLVLVKNPKPGYPSCSIFPEGVHCAQQHCERERESLHLGLFPQWLRVGLEMCLCFWWLMREQGERERCWNYCSQSGMKITLKICNWHLPSIF